MIVITPVLVILSWLLIGPALPLSLVIEVVLTLSLISVLRNRFRQKTIALIAMMGLMLTQCLVLVFIMHFQSWQPVSHPNVAVPAAWLLHALFRLDLPLAELGAVAAACIGIYVEFGRSRLNLTQAFPNLAFYEPTCDLLETAERLAKSAEIECPDLRLVDSGAPVAFTVRTRGKYTIAISVGLLESFESPELEACIAHEICHIKNRDFTLRAVVTILRVAVFTRVMSYFVETSFYRTREFLADRTAAILMGGARPLISALTKLQTSNFLPEDLSGNTICLFDGKKNAFELLSKHPNLSTRIRLLREFESTSKREIHRQLSLTRKR